MSAVAELRQAFAAIRHSLRSLLPHRTVKLSPTQPVQLYFETKIPWYTQWYIAWPLIAFDVVFMCVTPHALSPRSHLADLCSDPSRPCQREHLRPRVEPLDGAADGSATLQSPTSTQAR